MDPRIAAFAAPIDLLEDFHETMRRHARALCALADCCEAPRFPSREQRDMALAILRCFDEAALRHHRDEEEDVFPALVNAVAAEELNAVRDLLFRLRRDHRRLEAQWDPLSRMVAAIAQGHRTPLVPAHAAEFACTLERHLALEDAELLPLARRLVNPRLAEHVGARMARRRGGLA
jgi:hemerythrin-like domain-containing protein